MDALATAFRAGHAPGELGVVALARQFNLGAPISLRALLRKVALFAETSLARTFRVVRFASPHSLAALAKEYGLTKPFSLRKATSAVWSFSSLDQIKYFFVLLLENRSFDHMLGFSGIEGVDSTTGAPRPIDGLTEDMSNQDAEGKVHKVQRHGPLRFSRDPGHDLKDVFFQLTESVTPSTHEATNSGFVKNFARQVPPPADPSQVMRCMDADEVPVLTALAREFAVCDAWFSSIPGPTYPNRFFVHVATSGGWDRTPPTWSDEEGPGGGEDIIDAAVFNDNGFGFHNGSIYDRLNSKGIDWGIYAGGTTHIIAWTINGVHSSDLHAISDFIEDVKDKDFAKRLDLKRASLAAGHASDIEHRLRPDANRLGAYVHFEPFYDDGNDYKGGTSQHPLAHLSRGEQLIKWIYENLRASPIWERSCLIVTYDEHGGFFDHVPPPSTVAPGDRPITRTDSGFDFKRLGVRVPAVVISPLIPRNTIDGAHGRGHGLVRDHTSILATLEKRFHLEPLTNRDAQANDLSNLFRLRSARDDAPRTLPHPPAVDDENTGEAASAERTPSHALLAHRDLPLRKIDATLSAPQRQFLLFESTATIRRAPTADRPALRARLKTLKTVGELLDFIKHNVR
jgi:phospholipase C